MFKDFIQRIAVKSYAKKLNNKMLKDAYFNVLRKKPKSVNDKLICHYCLKEIKKRGILQ